MKTKFLLAAIILAAPLSLAFSPESTPAGEGDGEILNTQKIVVNNYYYLNGYEYASRIKRFHRSYVTFDFYSPLYTEIYWYRYTPYTWGVSIYDDWYYYGAVTSRHAWRSGFGGSYWWGYDPWWDYNPWTGYGWSSWYSPGVSFGVNFYLGRPYYHYPMAWNRWHHQNYRSYHGPVNIINHNTYNYYYGSQKRNSQSGTAAGYNPSHPYRSENRPGYTVSGGRSSVSGSTPAVSSGGRSSVSGSTPAVSSGGRTRTDGSRAAGDAGAGSGRGSSAGTAGRGNTTGANGPGNTTETNGNRSDSDNSNNGLRMGQYRRGVAQPADPDDNGLPRTNNPNVNDRTDPGREQGKSTGSSRNDREQSTVDRAPARSVERRQTQGTVRTTTRSTVPATTQAPVRTTTQKSVPARRQSKDETSSATRQTTKRDKKKTTTSTTGKSDDSGKSSSTKRRNR